MTIKNRVRIIGGVHRGRKLVFPPVPGLRPSADRVRETLFNWLQPVIAGARCLDLFAGSGALGLEAASREAARVVMVDQAAVVVSQLQANVAELGLDNVAIVRAQVPRWLRQPATPFDIVFLDPPFASGLLGTCCDLLAERGWLSPGARVYLETDRNQGLPSLPLTWDLEKEKTAGQVAFFLARG